MFYLDFNARDNVTQTTLKNLAIWLLNGHLWIVSELRIAENVKIKRKLK